MDSEMRKLLREAQVPQEYIEQVERDARELEWWRIGFSLRFGPYGGLPKPGTPLYGMHLKIQVEHPETGWGDLFDKLTEDERP